jgi:hypothetical protein
VDCVAATVGTATNVVSVDLADNAGNQYNVERATSLNPNWADADPSFLIGDGGEATLTADRDDPNAFYRYGSDAALAAVGNPTSGNGWSTESAVSARADSQHPQPRPAVATIDGSGLNVSGLLHDNNASPNMWLANAALDSVRRFPSQPSGHWIEYAFDQSYDIDEMLIWNYAEIQSPGGTTWQLMGVQHATILITETGNGSGWGSDNTGDWTQVHSGDLNWYAPPTGGLQVPANNAISIGDSAQYVLLYTPPDDRTNWANEDGRANLETGLSEVRFTLTAQPPPPKILATTLGDQTCFSFTSVSGTVYELERAEQLIVDVPVGSPNAGNGWDTTGAVSIDHHSGHPGASDRNVENTVNGSGISGDNGELHGTAVSASMWLSRPSGVDGSPQNAGQTPGSHYVTYAFDQAYTLDEMWIWTWNEQAFPGHGWKELEIQVSSNNGTNTNDWATVHTGNLPISPTTGNLSPSAVIDLGDVVAQYVAVINTGFGTNETHGGAGFEGNAGLSEVRFYEPGVGPPAISNAVFEGTGAMTTGDGGTQVLYDPNGHDTNFWYRVVPK